MGAVGDVVEGRLEADGENGGVRRRRGLLVKRRPGAERKKPWWVLPCRPRVAGWHRAGVEGTMVGSAAIGGYLLMRHPGAERGKHARSPQ